MDAWIAWAWGLSRGKAGGRLGALLLPDLELFDASGVVSWSSALGLPVSRNRGGGGDLSRWTPRRRRHPRRPRGRLRSCRHTSGSRWLSLRHERPGVLVSGGKSGGPRGRQVPLRRGRRRGLW
jgi:hypothetical protein